MAFSWALACAHVSPDPSAYGDEASLRVNNASIETVCSMHTRPSRSFAAGPNLLAEGTRIAPGQEHQHRLVSGSYRVTLLDCDGNRVLDQSDVLIEGSVQLVIYSDYPPGHRPPDGYTRVAYPTLGVAGTSKQP